MISKFASSLPALPHLHDMPTLRIALCGTLLVALAAEAGAAVCVNRFLKRSESAKQIVTLLTGKLTFQEAQLLSKNIIASKAEPVEWVDENGKTLARQYGELKVVRPMPVGCDGKTSGVVLIAQFLSVKPPVGKMFLKLDSSTTVQFDEQKSGQ